MGKLTKKEIAELIEAMRGLYPEAECALVHEDPFQLLVAVMLSAQTTDKSVNGVTPALFERWPDAAALAEAELPELEAALRTIGMHRTKAKNLKALCRVVASEYGGEVPADYDKLVALPGVGRKTANVVLSVGFGQPRIAVDTHVFRLAGRMGLAAEKDVLKTELALMKAIPEKDWIMMHHALIWHGRQVCHARKPQCESCGVRDWCRRNL
ncbi:MAG: endonuclease III [Bacillota bacterium]|nr:endonuclease III [Bacillota bacterium]